MPKGKEKCYLTSCRAERTNLIKLFRFPLNDTKRNDWKNACGFSTNYHLPKKAFLCSQHFSSADIINGMQYVHLKRTALPKVFPEKTTTEDQENINPQKSAGNETTTEDQENINPQKSAGNETTEDQENINPQKSAGNEATTEDQENINPQKSAGNETTTEDQENINPQKSAGNETTTEDQENINPQKSAGNETTTEDQENINPQKSAGNETTEDQENINPQKSAGNETTTEDQENINPQKSAGNETTTKDQENINPQKSAGNEITEDQENINPQKSAGNETTTEDQENINPQKSAGNETTTEDQENVNPQKPAENETTVEEQKNADPNETIERPTKRPKRLGSLSKDQIPLTPHQIVSLIEDYEELQRKCEAIEKESAQQEKEAALREDQLKREKQDLQKRLSASLEVNSRRRKKIKNMEQHVARMKKRIQTLLTAQSLQKKNKGSNSHLQVQKTLTDQAVYAMLRRMVHLDGGGYEDPHLRAFALSVHYYSPACYRYIRKKFNDSLPCEDTLSLWFSTMNGNAGFTATSFDALKRLSEDKGKKLPVALMVDDMSIKKRVNLVGQTVIGFDNLGSEHNHLLKPSKIIERKGEIVNEGKPRVAKEVCVFMVVCLDQKVKIPVGYFLHSKLSGHQLADLINYCMKKLHSVGAIVRAIVSDGAASNLKMAENLGVNLEPVKRVCPAEGAGIDYLMPSNEFRTYFYHPSDKSVKVYFILDICHMLKLVRNALATRKEIKDFHNNVVKWNDIENLHKVQMNEGLRLGNKLTDRHIKWFENKQKVSLAGQTLSKSVAVSLKFCEKLQMSKFENVSATARFCSVFNDLFDVFNSCTCETYGLKQPMYLKNQHIWDRALEEGKNYILGLQLKENGRQTFKSVFDDARKIGFIGFLVGIESIRGLFHDLVRTGPMIYLLTNKLSQDHLEAFFGKIRQMRGTDNNPSAKHFRDSYRRLLLGAEISVSKSSNCIPLEYIPILNYEEVNRELKTRAEKKKELRHKQNSIFVNLVDHYSSQTVPIISSSLSDFAIAVVSYVGGFVSKALVSKLECFLCEGALKRDHGMSDSGDFVNFISFKTVHRDGLTVPSQDVVQVCGIAETFIRKKNGASFAQLFELKSADLDNETVKKYCLSTGAFSYMPDHKHRNSVELYTYKDLITDVIKIFNYIRVKHMCMLINNLNIHTHVRHKYKKLILFNNQ
ncbi:DNA transposase [Frankliniella fusca]|uniref:DNA transposase n=1 Tax=Frankliniella fusca TaxID=407009 RepID=A0AAE1GW18_9NEOP|nr:DNA transposase [Frankliniella fusca]